MKRPTKWRPGVVFRSRAREHAEVVKSPHFILATDGSRMMVQGIVMEFRNYTYSPKTEEEFNEAKASWERQWGTAPSDGAGICLWGELPDEALTQPDGVAEKFMPAPDESHLRRQPVPVTHGARNTQTGSPVRG